MNFENNMDVALVSSTYELTRTEGALFPTKNTHPAQHDKKDVEETTREIPPTHEFTGQIIALTKPLKQDGRIYQHVARFVILDLYGKKTNKTVDLTIITLMMTLPSPAGEQRELPYMHFYLKGADAALHALSEVECIQTPTT